ncbi:MAG: hypothetical protein GTO30_07840, partial [Acidobacteria bacterium]|nr:hypothetical protein [Acidobacteriota bacterium]NIQ83697.1 hypothetical protein [Acidobacteriota bacterium]
MNEHLPNHALTAFDSLADERRAGVLDHVRACAECRAAWLAADSSRVFALLGRMPIPGRELDRLSARLDAALDREPPRIRPRRFLRVASIAASLLLALVLGAVLWNQEPTPGHA